MLKPARNQVTAVYRKGGNTWEESEFVQERLIKLPLIEGLPEIEFDSVTLYEKTGLSGRG